MSPFSAASTGRGLILFGHGSRDPLWCKPIEAVALRIRQRQPGVLVCCAYLELSAPDLATAASEIIAKGVHSVDVVPMFLGSGRHAREDLPRLVDVLRTQHPAVDFSLHIAMGEHPALLDLMAQIALGEHP